MTDPRIAECVREAALSERLDVVMSMTGLGSFDEESKNMVHENVDGIDLPVLSLARIVHSKRAAGREKDRAILPSLEDALVVQSALRKKPG